MEPDDIQVRGFAEAEKRRSKRILRRVLVRIEQGDSFATAHTAVINRGGALLLCRVGFEVGARLQITNLQTGCRASFRVVLCEGPDERRFRIGIELLDAIDFWGTAYDPRPAE